jgi:hypothetical protein
MCPVDREDGIHNARSPITSSGGGPCAVTAALAKEPNPFLHLRQPPRHVEPNMAPNNRTLPIPLPISHHYNLRPPHGQHKVHHHSTNPPPTYLCRSCKPNLCPKTRATHTRAANAELIPSGPPPTSYQQPKRAVPAPHFSALHIPCRDSDNDNDNGKGQC